MTDVASVFASPVVLGKSTAFGIVASTVFESGLVVVGYDVATASSLSFSIGALLLGFGMTVWATTVWIGDAFGAFLSLSVDDRTWSKRDAAAAFSIITVVGFGAMIGSVATTLVIRSIVS